MADKTLKPFAVSEEGAIRIQMSWANKLSLIDYVIMSVDAFLLLRLWQLVRMINDGHTFTLVHFSSFLCKCKYN